MAPVSRTRRSQNNQSKGKIPFVYYHPTWKPSAREPMWKLRQEGERTTLEQYNLKLGQKKRYFCPRCGYSCYRNPKEKIITRRNRTAFFSHHPVQNAPPCKLRTLQSEGKRYSTQEERSRAVEDGRLTIIPQWRQRPSEEELLGRDKSVYRGTVENAQGPIAGNPIHRHTGYQRLMPREITTLQFIADYIAEFLGQDIQLPNSISPEPFLDVFVHASEVQQRVCQYSGLYWGRADRVSIIKGYICISFGYREHCVYLGVLEENASERGWTVENLRGKYVMVAGQLKPAPKCQAIEDTKPIPRRCWQVIAKEWGAAGIIKEELVAILPHQTGVEWVEPTILEAVVSNPIRQPEVEILPLQSLNVEEQVTAEEQAVAEEIESVTYLGEQLKTSEVTNLPEEKGGGFNPTLSLCDQQTTETSLCQEKGGGSVSDSSSLETLPTQPQPEQSITQQQSRLTEIDTLNLPDSSDGEEAIYSFQGSAQPSRQAGSDSKASGNFNRQPIQTKSEAQFSSRRRKRKGLLNRLQKVVKRILRAALESLVRFFRN